jgi:hypothetical protein
LAAFGLFFKTIASPLERSANTGFLIGGSLTQLDVDGERRREKSLEKAALF